MGTTAQGRKILMLVGDYVEDYECMVRFMHYLAPAIGTTVVCMFPSLTPPKLRRARNTLLMITPEQGDSPMRIMQAHVVPDWMT
jgi:hypothetical protein